MAHWLSKDNPASARAQVKKDSDKLCDTHTCLFFPLFLSFQVVATSTICHGSSASIQHAVDPCIGCCLPFTLQYDLCAIATSAANASASYTRCPFILATTCRECRVSTQNLRVRSTLHLPSTQVSAAGTMP